MRENLGKNAMKDKRTMKREPGRKGRGHKAESVGEKRRWKGGAIREGEEGLSESQT